MDRDLSGRAAKLTAFVCAAMTVALVCMWQGVFYKVCIGEIYSDVHLHVVFALGHNDYGLSSFIIRILYSLGSEHLAQTCLSLLMTLSNILTLVSLWWLLRTLLPRLDRWQALLAVELALLCGPWIIPGYQTSLYRYAHNGNLYHNMTVLFSRAFIPGCFVFFFRCFDRRHDKIKWRDLLLFALCFLLCTLFKPNFAFAFIPLLAALLLYDLVRFRGTYLKNELLLGLGVVPAGIVCILQYLILFDDSFAGSSSSVAFRLVLGAELLALLVNYLRGLLLPVYTLSLQARREESRGHIGLILLTEAAALLEGAVFTETGFRETHGNFLWGGLAMYPVVFSLGVALLFRMMGGANWKKPADAVKCLLGVVFLLGHLAAGLYFLYYFVHIDSYFI